MNNFKVGDLVVIVNKHNNNKRLHQIGIVVEILPEYHVLIEFGDKRTESYYKDSLRLLSKYSDKKYNYVFYLDDKEFCRIYFKEHLPTIMDSFISQNIPFRLEVKRKCKCNTK